MLAAFGVDTLSPDVTPRRLWVLLQRLPDGVWHDQEVSASWTVEAHLLASVLDRLGELTWLTAKINSKKGANVKMPDPVPRPGAQKKARKSEGQPLSMSSLMSVMKEV